MEKWIFSALARHDAGDVNSPKIETSHLTLPRTEIESPNSPECSHIALESRNAIFGQFLYADSQWWTVDDIDVLRIEFQEVTQNECLSTQDPNF